MTSPEKNNALAAPQGDEGEDKPKVSVVQISAQVVAKQVRVARFRGRPMVLEEEPYPHFVPLNKDRFESVAYPLLGGISRSRVNDVFAYLSNIAEDLTENERFVLFGLEGDADAEVWDMDELAPTPDTLPAAAIWRSPHAPLPAPTTGSLPIPFIMSLAGGDQGVYDDIMQSLAPLIMTQKPDGVIWWVGDGANGKSTLMDAIYRVFPGQLSSITVKRLTDGRDTPSLNGTLANVVKESSEGRIEDTEIYKAVGTHENFRVHRFHSQDDIEIRGNVHHIFSGNSVPTFNDKGYSARRRTFIIPFNQRFESDPEFEARTFTPEFFGRLIAEMQKYAVRLRNQGYKYKWSGATLAAKEEYDTDANNAEEYAKHIIAEGVVAFESFHPLKIDYENWCADEGYVPLGITNLRRALQSYGFDRQSVRIEGRVAKIYRLPAAAEATLQAFGMGRPGLFTIPGFKATDVTEETTVPVPVFNEVAEKDDPEPEEDAPKKPSILNNRW